MTTNLNTEFIHKNKGVSNAVDTINMARHRWYYYKEGFSPNLVASAIDEYGLDENSVIHDPFNGSGTVTLTAAQKNISSFGFEINPFTSFLAHTKSLNVDKKEFKGAVKDTIKCCETGSKSLLEGFSTFTKSKENISKWLFNLDVLRAFEGGFTYAESKNTKISNLLKLALITSAMDNCNASKDGKCLRYRKNWQSTSYDKDSFLNSFAKKCEEIEEDLDQIVLQSPLIETLDSRSISDMAPKNQKFDFCITSPPYLNTFDYTDIYRPELFLGRFVKSNSELYNLRLRTLRSHVQAKWEQPELAMMQSTLLQEYYEKIVGKKDELMHKDIPAMIAAYFEDMAKIFKNLWNYANNNAKLWIVVSTSAYANEHIPVDLILADIATKNNWKLKEVGVLREINKRKSKYSPDITKLRESVIILYK